MSKVGKEILIKIGVQALPHFITSIIVVQALPQFIMSVFKFPISICKAIEKIVSSLWWKQKATRKGIHWKNGTF